MEEIIKWVIWTTIGYKSFVSRQINMTLDSWVYSKKFILKYSASFMRGFSLDGFDTIGHTSWIKKLSL